LGSVRRCCFALALVCAGMAPAWGDAAPARLAGVFWWMSDADTRRSAEDWKGELDALQALGADLMIVSDLSGRGGADAPEGEAPLRGFFDETDRRGMRVFLSTLSMANWWVQPDPGPELARAEARIRETVRLYGARPSFHGWYVPYELYHFTGPQAELIRALYRGVAERCKAASDKPVMISPFFLLDCGGKLGDFAWVTPEEYRDFWTGLLRQAPAVDIVALQDSGEHLSCYTLDDRRPFFAAMKEACGAAGKTLWANVESGELEVASLDDYVARFGLKTHVNDPKLAPYWRAVPAEKFRDKLRLASEFTDTAVTWGYQEFLRPARGPQAAAAHAAYAALMPAK